MKIIISLTLILSALICSAQTAAKKPDTLSVPLSAYERQQVVEHESIMREVMKHNQDYFQFLSKYFSANNIDPARVSLHPDSLKFLPPNKFRVTLNPKKK